MFIGKILENGNDAFECRDGKTVEEIPILTKGGRIGYALLFDGFSVLVPKYLIRNMGDVYKKSEVLTCEELFGFVISRLKLK